MQGAAASTPDKEHITIAVSGAHGDHTVDLRQLMHQGVMLVGQTRGFNDDKTLFHHDLAENTRHDDASYSTLLDTADAWVTRNGTDLPEEPSARGFLPDPACITDPLLSLNLAEVGIGTIIQATDHTTDCCRLKVDAFDDVQWPQHHRGVSTEPGIYFLGLPWLSRRGSTFI